MSGETCPHQVAIIWGGGKLKGAREGREAVVPDFYIVTIGSLQEGGLSSGPSCCCLMGLLVLARSWRVLPALMFGAPGTWCHVELWFLAPWPVVRGPVFWFHSGTPEQPGLAFVSPPLAWKVVKCKGFKILGSNIFCRLVFLGIIWNLLTFLRNACYWGNYGRLGCLHTYIRLLEVSIPLGSI